MRSERSDTDFRLSRSSRPGARSEAPSRAPLAQRPHRERVSTRPHAKVRPRQRAALREIYSAGRCSSRARRHLGPVRSARRQKERPGRLAPGPCMRSAPHSLRAPAPVPHQSKCSATCRFQEVCGRYPKRVTVVSYDFKRRRFVELLGPALHLPLEFVGVARSRHRPGFPLTQASHLITRHRAVGDLREEDARRVNPHVWRTPRYRRRTAFASARTRELRRVT